MAPDIPFVQLLLIIVKSSWALTFCLPPLFPFAESDSKGQMGTSSWRWSTDDTWLSFIQNYICARRQRDGRTLPHSTNLKESMHYYVHCSIILNHQHLEAAQVAISRWVDKKAVVHLPSGIFLSHKKEGNLTLCDSKDGPGKYYANVK